MLVYFAITTGIVSSSSPYFHGHSELRNFFNARLIYFIYWFITIETAPITKK